MHQGKFHLLAILLIPTGIVLFGLVQNWIVDVIYLLVAGILLYFAFRKKK